MDKKGKKTHTYTRQQEQKADKLARTRRSVWYVLRVVLIIAAVVLLCYAAFVEALYISNNYIIVTEGMALRADCILNDNSVSTLYDHFSDGERIMDTALFSGKYDAYHVESYNYDLKIESFSVYPWSKEAKFIVRETVTQIIASPYDDNITEPVPEWTNARYEVILEKFSGKWIITKLTVLETNPEAEPPNTPDYSKLDQVQ